MKEFYKNKPCFSIANVGRTTKRTILPTGPSRKPLSDFFVGIIRLPSPFAGECPGCFCCAPTGKCVILEGRSEVGGDNLYGIPRIKKIAQQIQALADNHVVALILSYT